MLRWFLCAVVLLRCIQGQQLPCMQDVHARCMEEVGTEEFMKCMPSHPMLSALSTASLMPELFGVDPICRNLELFINSTQCMGDLLQECLAQPMLRLISTHKDRVDAIRYLCQHQTEVNVDCLEGKIGEGDPCDVNPTPSSPQNSSCTLSSCRDFLDYGQCYRDLGKDCANHSVGVVDQFWLKTFPQACRSCAPFDILPHFLLLGACAVGLSSLPAIFQ